MKLSQTVDPCHHCGACLPLCIWDQAERMGQSGDPGLCRECRICYRICACLPDRGERSTAECLVGDEGRDFGPYVDIHTVHTAAAAVGVQDGGFVTQLGEHLLHSGYADAVLVTGRDTDWRPYPFWAEDAIQIARAAGAKYTVSPTLAVLPEGLERFRRAALVLLPCQSTAVRRLLNIFPEWQSRISLVIGLFCTLSFAHQPFFTMLEQLSGCSANEVRRLDIRHGRLIADTVRGTADWPIRGFHSAVWPRCVVCQDLTAESADVSVGSIGSSSGSNTVIIRSQRAQHVISSGASAGLWSLADVDDLAALLSQSNRKRDKIEKIPEAERRLYGPLSVRGSWKRRTTKVAVDRVET
jgi:coenzyme F420 hydrogenase subunit beta